ncbi:MAG: BamA/TamA family outer membrane protein, partial [Candidatus Poribacteria bacterium]|nr:BamA/TamA family outer membrane protein [Candidatus Poribacteria bacterium]
ESHANLQKSTDWFVTNWKSSLELRENPPITPGQMRSLTFQYDFDKRTNSLGWHSTLLVEHSSAAAGSDFDFTRLLLHLRYAFPLAENRIRTRFLFGFSDASLPIQRQFVIGGMGGLRGYPWLRHTEESAGIIDYKSGHRSSPYAFAGDRGFLLNVEYHYRLANLSSWGIFRNAFAIAFLDEGQVWNVSGPAYTFDPKGNIGIGLQFGENDFIVRVNIAKAFESSQGIQITTTWYYSF